MKRKFLTVLTTLVMLFLLNSCDVYTYPTAQEDIYVETQANVVRSNIDFNVVMHYGTPYEYLIEHIIDLDILKAVVCNGYYY